jgi:hypothetical protein
MRSSQERNNRLENLCWRIWHVARKKKQVRRHVFVHSPTTRAYSAFGRRRPSFFPDRNPLFVCVPNKSKMIIAAINRLPLSLSLSFGMAS